MPSPSSHLPRFPHSHHSRSRSQSPKPSPGDSRGGAAISLPPRHDPYPASPSRPSSRLGLGAAEIYRNAMVAGPSRPSGRWNPVNYRNTPECYVSDIPPDDFSGPPSQASWPSGIGPSNALSPPRWPTHLAFPSHIDISPQSAPYSQNAELNSLFRNDYGPALPSRHFSRLGTPREDMNAIASSSHPSVPGQNLINHQNSTARLVGDYSNAQPPQVSHWPVNPSGFVPPNVIRTLESHGSGVQQHTFVTPASYYTDAVQAQQLLAPLPPPATPSQQFLNSEPLIYSSQPQHRSSGMFRDAHDFSVTGGTFQVIEGNVNLTSNHFMEKLLKETIPGAEFDSSARDPPPRCHPGTRLDILERCLHFVRTCNGKRKTRWVVGAAGVGKSAIMQSVVESPELVVSTHASVFFSINGRDDGIKAVVTISYQLAAKSELYRQLIEREITRDPSLLRSSMAKQFLKLIVEPFIHNPQLNSVDRVLIAIDGLDECKNPRTQLELLCLISDFCNTNPSSPLVWLIASRPETHITSFFSRVDIAPAYEKEEIMVDSDEAREDVELYLRAKLKMIKEASDSVDSRWPEEQDLWKLANAAGGLFAYAQTAIRYIDDVTVGSPASQLSEVLNVINNHNMADDHPMALLNALYARILYNVPSKVMMNTRKFLLALVYSWYGGGPDNFIELCNWLGMTPDEAYAALNHLRSVLRVPRRDEAHKEKLRLFHKSFMDYYKFDFRRSGFSHDIGRDARQLMRQCAFRIFNEAPDGINFGFRYTYKSPYGTLRRGPGTGDNISVSWPVDKIGWDDNAMRLAMYKLAIEVVTTGVKREDPTFQYTSCIHILSSLFHEYNWHNFPSDLLCDLVFDESRRQESMVHGILKQMPVRAVDVPTLKGKKVKLRFRRPATTATNLSDPWNPFCEHKWEGKWGEGNDQDLETSFWLGGCNFCEERVKRQLEDWKTRSSDLAVPTLFTSTGYCCVELRFVDPDDGISEWTYWLWVKLSLEERKKYGSDV